MCQPACVLCYFFRHHTQRYPAHSTLDGVARVSLEPLLIVKALLPCSSHWLDFGSPVNQVHSDAAIPVRLVALCHILVLGYQFGSIISGVQEQLSWERIKSNRKEQLWSSAKEVTWRPSCLLHPLICLLTCLAFLRVLKSLASLFIAFTSDKPISSCCQEQGTWIACGSSSM